MTQDDYKKIQYFLGHTCGIVLGDHKQYLVTNRLTPLLARYDLASLTELADALTSNLMSVKSLKTAVVDAMTTNETFWFRDDMQFEELKQKILPEIFEKKPGSIKIWSAACSSGQEPYTVSMCVEDICKKSGKKRNVQIIGTDISESILLQAKTAAYLEMSVSRGLDMQTRQRFFHKTHEGYQLNPEITARVKFQQFNLLKPYSVLGRFDIIFCRNVLIYFSEAVKKDILTRMAQSLETGGYLFLSSTESMPTSINSFETIRGAGTHYYKKTK